MGSRSQEAQRLIDSCNNGGAFFPSSVWWRGPADVRKATAEPDQYGTVGKVDAAAWRTENRMLLFGPDRVTKANPYPKWSHTIMCKRDRFDRKAEQKFPGAKTEIDMYGVRAGDTFLKPKTRGGAGSGAGFARSNSACDLKRRIKHNTVFRKFNKDFTVSGSALAFKSK